MQPNECGLANGPWPGSVSGQVETQGVNYPMTGTTEGGNERYSGNSAWMVGKKNEGEPENQSVFFRGFVDRQRAKVVQRTQKEV